MGRIDIKSMELCMLDEKMKKLDQPMFRGKQIYHWVHNKLIDSFDEMTNVPKEFRDSMKKKYKLTRLRMPYAYISHVDGTRKYLFRLSDGNIIESVSMRYAHGISVCISTQVGCRMGCRFCASTLEGLVRNLTPSEMLEQVYKSQKDIGERVSHVVLMGSGEPLDNYDNLLTFIRILSSKEGLNISQRNITVSTCGLVPEIRKLAEEKLQITLAVSLHASNQETRKKLMPIATKYDIKEVIDVCKYYFQETGRRVTFEYSMVKGENDSEEAAFELVELVKGFPCHINLIAVNPIEEREYEESDEKVIQNFKKYLEKNGINVTIRREMGRDIDGACGQLRRRYLEERDLI